MGLPPMPSGGLLTYALGMPAHHRERKEMLEDEARQFKVKDLYEQRHAIRDNIRDLAHDNPDYLKGVDAIKSIEGQLDDIHDPVKNPGALQKDWEFIKGLITRKHPTQPTPAPQAPPPTTSTVADITLPAEPGFSDAPAIPASTSNVAGPAGLATPVTTPAMQPGSGQPGITLKGHTTTVRGEAPKVHDTMAVPTAKLHGLVAPGNIPIWNRPFIANDDGTHSSEFSTSFTDENKNSPYYGKEVLVPTIVDGKFLTPDGKKPPEGSQQEHDMLVKARDHYEKTGQHLGVFESPDHADKYADALHNRGKKGRPTPASYQTPQERKQQAGQQKAEQAAERFLQASPPSEAQKALAEARAQVGAQKAKIDAYMEDWDKEHPDAPKEERDKYRQRVFENVAGFKSSMGGKYVYKNAKINGVPRMVRYNDKDGSLEFADGTPMTEEQAASVTFDTGKIPPGMTYDKTTGQVWDKEKNIRYNKDDPNLPPEVQAMFRGHDIAQAEQQAYGLRLTQERGQSYNNSRPIAVLDTQNGNRPTEVKFDEFRASPGRYVPAAAGAKALAQVNMFEDIGRTSRATRDAINGLTEDFPEDMKAKIAVALTADDHGGALNALLASAAFANLSRDQYGFLVATRQLAENAMAMRSILGAGQGSEDVRRAIQSTLPSLLSPNREYALMQLDAFDKTLEQLHRGIQDVPLGQEGWTVASGDYKPGPSGTPSSPGAAPGGTQPPKLKGGRSITQVKAWMQQQPQWQGQTVTNDMALKYITDNHYTPTP
jgi:hypothetical protein